MAIFTAIPVEYNAVRQHLVNLRLADVGSIYEVGDFSSISGNWQILIYETGVGGLKVANAFERIAKHFQPEVAFFIGTAGGIKDVEIGDIVVATKVYSYEPGRIQAEEFFTRPEVGNSTFALVERARFEARKGEWLQRIPTEIPSKMPKVKLGPIAAGEKLLASTNSELYNIIKSHFNDALAIEMEGHGFFSAAYTNPHIKVLIIRGISDLIDNKHITDKQTFQKIAAQHASAFAFEILAKLTN